MSQQKGSFSKIRGQKLWHKVANDLSLQVSLGKWPVGSIIPGELELANHYRVSRDTIRKALDYLTTNGLFERRPHTGTRVKSTTSSGKFLHVMDNIRAIDQYGNRYPRAIQDVRNVVINEEVAVALGLEYGKEMIRFENIRIATTGNSVVPMVVTYVYVFPRAKEVIDLAKAQPHELIVSLVEQVTGQECVEVKQTFSATIMPKHVAKYFKFPNACPGLRLIRNYLDDKGRNIVVTESFYPADKFSFSISVKKRRWD